MLKLLPSVGLCNWPEKKRFQIIIVKGDSKIYVDALNKNLSEASWEIQPLLYDASILATSFIDGCFCWIKRDANSVAHEISMHILYCNGFEVREVLHSHFHN